jgi:hypothetical protein
MLSQRWNSFRVCSVCDEIRSVYAQHECTYMYSTCTFYRWLSMRKNSFLVCSVCDEIVSSYAQCAIKSFPRMLCMRAHAIIFENHPKDMQILTKNNRNFEKPSKNHLIGPKWKFWSKHFFYSSLKKFGSAFAQSPRKCSSIEILAKI